MLFREERQGEQGLTLQQAYQKFIEIYLPSKYGSPVTWRGYTYDVKEWLDQAQIKYVDELDLEAVQSYLATGKNRERKGSTRQRKVAALKAFFTYLEKTLQLLPTDFSAAMIWPKVTKDDPRFLTPEQYQAILREAGHHARDLAMLEVLLQTGIRLSELTGLKLDDVDLPIKPSPNLTTGYGIIRIKRKGGKVKELALNYKACRALLSYKRVRPQSDYPTFFLTKYCTPMTNRSVEKAFKKYAVAAGVSWAHVHTFRTTHITQHIAKGTDLKTVQENAGHSSLKTTDYYAGLVKEAQVKAMQEHAL
jgi:site-specific recombinase XerD